LNRITWHYSPRIQWHFSNRSSHGSSILQLYTGIGDLSRRKASYIIHGLSFREYLHFEKGIVLQAVSIEQLLANHSAIAAEIVKHHRILPLFETYLTKGYYPFYKEGLDVYYDRIIETINVILETDIPSVSDITFETSLRLKTLLALLAQTVPYTPNLKKLTEQLFLSDYRIVLKYLNYLDKAELINVLGAEGKGNQIMNKPDKIYLNNTNLAYAIAPDKINKGTMRETFLYNQLSAKYSVNYPKQGDFAVNNYTIEVGGPNKKQKQIHDIKNAYIAKDEIETGFGNVVPLWLFGLLY